jgi:hypothetical protein
MGVMNMQLHAVSRGVPNRMFGVESPIDISETEL